MHTLLCRLKTIHTEYLSKSFLRIIKKVTRTKNSLNKFVEFSNEMLNFLKIKQCLKLNGVQMLIVLVQNVQDSISEFTQLFLKIIIRTLYVKWTLWALPKKGIFPKNPYFLKIYFLLSSGASTPIHTYQCELMSFGPQDSFLHNMEILKCLENYHNFKRHYLLCLSSILELIS